MKSSLSRTISSLYEEEQNEVKQKVSTKFCLSCKKEESNTSSVLVKSIIW